MSLGSEDSASGLVETLALQSTAYGHLVSLARQEQSAICAQDTPALLQAIEVQQKVLAELNHLEENRAAYAARTARALGISDEPRLGLLATRVAPPLGSRLSQLRQEILAHVADLAALNRQNALLLTSSMDLTNSTLNYLARGAESHTTYTPPGYRQGNRATAGSVVVDRPA